ncbi:hypothetical protein C882_0767 [Caenispirillum salinarum AK4]|uniref:DUF3108 domain-containing protein n=1 Tax=Caenispirillum salinarum AK4 TaxID=1238182 RepID=K9HIX2_9PROT|nr:DUF3108 domain-containing protein [Caenispirillum salinarum]EKV28556.1 hypothetical protein C882_0767 [Caenispirillum salinarum AK4]
MALRRPLIAAVCLALALSAGLLLAPREQEARAALPNQAVLTYDLRLGGFDIGRAEVAVALPPSVAEGPYRITTDVAASGMLSVFTDFRSSAATDGALAGATVRPRLHEVANVWRGETRQVRLAYDDTAPMPEALVDPPPDADEREPVDPSDTAGSVDPLSGVLQLVADGDGEAGPVKIFDGRRLYTLALDDPEPAAASVGGFSGPALRADLRYERLGGASRKWDSRKEATASVTLAPPAALGLPVAVPLRVVVPTTGFGGFIIELAEVRTGTAG